jgi:hypothetical protein
MTDRIILLLDTAAIPRVRVGLEIQGALHLGRHFVKVLAYHGLFVLRHGAGARIAGVERVSIIQGGLALASVSPRLFFFVPETYNGLELPTLEIVGHF